MHQLPKLTIELVPQSTWYNNVRSNVEAMLWEKLKKSTAEKAKHRCEICGGRGRKWPVECHEIWHYDDIEHVQKLLGLIALCPACHSVKHIGCASVQGKLPSAMRHLMRVNNWSNNEALSYIDKQFEIWKARSQYEWKLDISFLSAKERY